METSIIKTGITWLEGLMKSHAGDGSLKTSMPRCHMFGRILRTLARYRRVTPGTNQSIPHMELG